MFRRLAEQTPKVAEAATHSGNAALRSENHALALASAQEAVRLAPYWVPAKMLLARSLIASGKEEEAGDGARPRARAGSRGRDPPRVCDGAAALGRDAEARAILPYATGDSVLPAAVRTLGLLDLDAGDPGRYEMRVELLSMGAQSYDTLFFRASCRAARRRRGALRYYSR